MRTVGRVIESEFRGAENPLESQGNRNLLVRQPLYREPQLDRLDAPRRVLFTQEESSVAVETQNCERIPSYGRHPR